MTSTNQPIRAGILLEDGFEDSEYQVPFTAMQQAGVDITVLGTRMNDEYEGTYGTIKVKPDATPTEVRAEDFDAIVIPGGRAPDRIRTNRQAVRLVADAIEQGKVVAAVCHGPQVLIETDMLRGKQVTGFQAIRTDLQNAGATYLDRPVVESGSLITSRRPSDLAAFSATLLKHLSIFEIDRPDLDPNLPDERWWHMAERWNGSSRTEIIGALSTAIAGEHYTLDAFEQYVERATDMSLKLLLGDAIANKKRHIELLEARMETLGETAYWQAAGAKAVATFQSWIQSSDDTAILRRALGDLQTGIVDAYGFANRLTDPISADLFAQIASGLSLHEERLADLYRTRAGSNVEPPQPTTLAAIG